MIDAIFVICNIMFLILHEFLSVKVKFVSHAGPFCGSSLRVTK